MIISNSMFDYLWVQVYNNNPTHSLDLGENTPFNYEDWVTFIAATHSPNARLFLGVPAAPSTSNGYSTGGKYYATPNQFANIVSDIRFQTCR